MARRSPEETLDRFGDVTRGLRLLSGQAYATFDVGTTQAKFLRYLGQHQPLSQAELARATVTDPTLTGRVVQSLIERGWVDRDVSREDRRQYVLSLTAAGQRVRKRVEAARRRVAERLVAALDDRDLADFDRIAQKLKAALASAADADAEPT
ncbi:MAG TPA: MarR family transcriptional regulator [Polyangiaceae bacterium]|nr:MarR family transcriptional regulator [Polyangiaceae bacterium]